MREKETVLSAARKAEDCDNEITLPLRIVCACQPDDEPEDEKDAPSGGEPNRKIVAATSRAAGPSG